MEKLPRLLPVFHPFGLEVQYVKMRGRRMVIVLTSLALDICAYSPNASDRRDEISLWALHVAETPCPYAGYPHLTPVWMVLCGFRPSLERASRFHSIYSTPRLINRFGPIKTAWRQPGKPDLY